MEESIDLALKASILDPQKQLVITPEFIQYGATSFTKFEIDELRYGVKWIKGYRFIIGRIYCIDIKSLSGGIIKIRLKSVYGIRKKKLDEKYIQILNALFKFFINNISKGYVNKFCNGQDFEILGIKFIQNGIIPDKKSALIKWEDLGTKDYRTYYAVFSNTNPANYKSFTYLYDWNTIVLYSVSRTILRDKQLWKE